jgi:hypothetical protein
MKETSAEAQHWIAFPVVIDFNINEGVWDRLFLSYKQDV